MRHVLVTGGAGFIGAYLVKRLIDSGRNVVIVDTLRDVGGISYVHPEADFLNKDICDSALYEKLNDYNFDSVFHLAAQSAGEPSYDDPKYDSLTNSYGTLMLARYCKNMKISKLVYASTVAVYGNNSNGIINEESPINPDSIYGVSKYAGEMYVKQTLAQSDVDYTILRVFNTYGPGENLNFTKKGMVSIYISYVWKSLPIEIKGSLERYRDFTYIKDTVEAFLLAEKTEIAKGNTYNISSGVKTTVSDLIQNILTSFGKDPSYPIIELEGTPGDSFGYHSDISKIKKDLNWKPRTSLKEGLNSYASWVKSLGKEKKLDSFHPFKLSKDN